MNSENDAILLELQYLPPIQYFSKCVAYDKVWIEQKEHYRKGSYRNRCHIAGVNSVLRLTIPLQKGKNEQQPIREVKIAYNEDWQRQHWVSIYSAYGNAPFFDYYAEELKSFYQKPYDFLFDFNLNLIHKLIELLQLDLELLFTDRYEPIPMKKIDFRNQISPKSRIEDKAFKIIPYPQVFLEKNGFLPNLSILDLLFCTGPQAALILEESFSFIRS